jgi:hypothetical protein
MKFLFNIYWSLLVCLLSISAQNTYYVSPSGNNSNPGSITQPWEKIQYSINQLNPGDTLLIREGTYEEKIDLDVSGLPGQYITIKNFPEEDVIIDAINFSDDQPILWTDNAYLHIEGLHLTNNIINYASGLVLQGAAHHIEIINNKISHIKFSADPDAPINSNTNAVPLNIYADSALDSIHNIIIRGNEIYNNQTGYSENISAGGNFSIFLIENNIVHDNTNIGIDIGGNYQTSPNPNFDQGRYGIIRNNIVYNCNSPYSPAAGIYVDGGRDIIVENNLCYNNGYGGEIGCEENGSTSNVTFRNNIFHHNAYAGMHIGGYDPETTGIIINCKVYHNTFYHNDTGNFDNGELILSKSEDCVIANNILYLSPQNVLLYAYREQDNLIFDYNLVYAQAGIDNIITYGNYEETGLDDYYNSSGYGVHSIFGDPLFLDASSSNFHLQINSLAIDTGNEQYTSGYDYDGTSRPQGEGVDLGAFEYNSLSVNDSQSSSKLSVYPNPTAVYINFPHPSYTTYKLTDFSGKTLMKGKISGTRINISGLINGLYLLELYQPGKPLLKQIIIKK